MKILIVDDEKLARDRLSRMLKTLGYEDVAIAEDADSALEMFKEQKFELVFLDINMPKVSGLELGYEMKYLDSTVDIIYQTAYDNHALEAFDIGAVAYLVKPYSIDQVKSSIERVQKPQSKNEDIHILSKVGDRYLMLNPKDIHYVKADLSEVMLRTKEGFSYYAQKISDLEPKLQSYGFVRIHRSYLINIDEIKEIQTIEQSKLRFSFKNNSDNIESSKDGAKIFREKFQNV